MQWMQSGLPLLGGRTSVRWLGSTAVEMVLSDPKPPFSRVTLVIFLEPRDLPWWPVARALGRRDLLIIRGTLRRAPAVEFEVFEAGSWSERDALPRLPRSWSARKGEQSVHYDGTTALERADALLERAKDAALAVKRLSLRRSEPHLQLHVPLPDRQRPAHEFFEAFHLLAEFALR